MLVFGSTAVFHQVVDIDSHVSRDGSSSFTRTTILLAST